MHAGRKRIRDAQIVSRRAANGDAQPADLKMLGAAIRVFDNQFSHYSLAAAAFAPGQALRLHSAGPRQFRKLDRAGRGRWE